MLVDCKHLAQLERILQLFSYKATNLIVFALLPLYFDTFYFLLFMVLFASFTTSYNNFFTWQISLHIIVDFVSLSLFTVLLVIFFIESLIKLKLCCYLFVVKQLFSSVLLYKIIIINRYVTLSILIHVFLKFISL